VTEVLRNDTENSGFPNVMKKNIVMIFQNIAVFTVFLIK